MKKSKIIGIGACLPSKIVTNKDLEKLLNTNDDWIRSRTGISQRHIADDNQDSADLATKAAIEAITDSGINPKNIDLIINCTTTPGHHFPAAATKIQANLGLRNIPAFDLQAVCAGFIYGLDVADNLIKSGKYTTILLTSAEKMSKLLDWQDRSTAILFGDGSGAVILTSSDDASGIIDTNIYADGSFYDLLYADNQGIKMNGREVFKHAVEKMANSVETILMKNNLSINDVTYFVPHQANIRIIDNIAARLKVNNDKIVITIGKHANCSAASIPLALSELKASDKLKKNDIILFAAFGAGFAWGAAIVRW